ncbi:MAG: UDP-N-acetylmuramate dehydrogenase [Dysgonamonadaceae bacterium]|jgi:UDP-N-acetylmuramate dehydrogenase|nr:UDP-N-acetylmuramate dehydrogenase [Dysgonamonadaceae bacterium]
MQIKHNIQLQLYNSFRTKAVAKLFCEPHNVSELIDVLGKFPDEKRLILGKGCNLFFTKDFDGLIIKPTMKGVFTLFETDDFVEIEAGAAEDWDDFVAYCVSNDYAGIENLSFIPSSVGAAPIQNIGAYGAEVKDVIAFVRAVDITTGVLMDFSNAACEFGYRDSIFKKRQNYIITSVVFRLQKSFVYQEKYIDLNRELENITNPTLSQVRDAVIRVRTRKLPDYIALPNAGSFFKNPILTEEEKRKLLQKLPDAPIYNAENGMFKTSAAYLIDKAGYKGKRKGNVGTYEHHALIIVNYGTENGIEIQNFMCEIQEKILCEFGIELETEVWVY